MLRLVSNRARSSERHQLRGFGYFKRTGPGFITGAADDDPAVIGTYSHVGARFRFDLVWMAPLCLPLASAYRKRRRDWVWPAAGDSSH
jgi:Mn2+/Fe2+ NRAMP family transporter